MREEVPTGLHQVYPEVPKVTWSEKASVVSWDVALFSVTSLLPHRQDKASTRSTPLQKSGKKSLVKETAEQSSMGLGGGSHTSQVPLGAHR